MQKLVYELLMKSFKTGEYEPLKNELKKNEESRVFFIYNKKSLQMANYFINLNQKINLSLFTGAEQDAFEKALAQSNLKKIQKLMKQYEIYHVIDKAQKGEIKAVKEFVERTGKVNIFDKWNTPLLARACEGQNVDLACFLIEKGARVNPYFFECWDILPLQAAILSKNEKMTELLIEKGAKIGKTTCLVHSYPSPLSVATTVGDEKCLSLLLKEVKKICATHPKKAKEFLKESNALYNAVSNGYTSMVKDLLEVGAPFFKEQKSWFDFWMMSKVIATNNKEIVDLVFNEADKKERADLFRLAVLDENTGLMYHLYQRKGPVHPQDVKYLNKEELICHGLEQGHFKVVEKILKELEKEEEESLNWDKLENLSKQIFYHGAGRNIIKAHLPAGTEDEVVLVKKEVEKTPNQSKNIEKTEPLSWSGTLVFESSYQKQGTFATQPQERYVLSQKKRVPLSKEEIRQKD